MIWRLWLPDYCRILRRYDLYLRRMIAYLSDKWGAVRFHPLGVLSLLGQGKAADGTGAILFHFAIALFEIHVIMYFDIVPGCALLGGAEYLSERMRSYVGKRRKKDDHSQHTDFPAAGGSGGGTADGHDHGEKAD